MTVQGIPCLLDAPVAEGLVARALLTAEQARRHTSTDFPEGSDVVLSIGGDGTLLNSAHQVAARETPILGVNIGRLGFLADTDVTDVKTTLLRFEQGEYRIEQRMVLEAQIHLGNQTTTQWALNDIVLEHQQTTKLISVDVNVNGAPLTTYWADGLIISTPTGSTAYSLSVGGPILVPDCGVVVLTPMAPHTLTVRPLVAPDSATIEVEIVDQPFVIAADGRLSEIDEPRVQITIRRAAHHVRLIKLPEHDYFQTLRGKLRWSGR